MNFGYLYAQAATKGKEYPKDVMMLIEKAYNDGAKECDQCREEGRTPEEIVEMLYNADFHTTMAVDGKTPQQRITEAIREYGDQCRDEAREEEIEVCKCDVEGCNKPVSSGGCVWRKTGYWSVCSDHFSACITRKEPQPQMKHEAVERENKRDKKTGYTKTQDK